MKRSAAELSLLQHTLCKSVVWPGSGSGHTQPTQVHQPSLALLSMLAHLIGSSISVVFLFCLKAYWKLYLFSAFVAHAIDLQAVSHLHFGKNIGCCCLALAVGFALLRAQPWPAFLSITARPSHRGYSGPRRHLVLSRKSTSCSVFERDILPPGSVFLCFRVPTSY